MNTTLYASHFPMQDQVTLAYLSRGKPMTKLQLMQFLPPASVYSLLNSGTLVADCGTQSVITYYKVRDDFFSK